MKKRSTNSRNSRTRSVVAAFISLTSLLLLEPYQGAAEASETRVTENISALEEIVDTADAAVVPHALVLAPQQCGVRCCDNRLSTEVASSQSVCINMAQSFCGVGHIKRIRYAGVYIYAQAC